MNIEGYPSVGIQTTSWTLVSAGSDGNKLTWYILLFFVDVLNKVIALRNVPSVTIGQINYGILRQAASPKIRESPPKHSASLIMISL